MEQYISKAAIAAWMEKIKKNKESEQGWHFDEFDEGYLSALDDIENFLNTMETKEVDLEKENKDILNQYYYFPEEAIDTPTIIRITAKHFFELGLKTQKGEK